MNKSIIEEICLNNAFLSRRSFSEEYEKKSDEAYKLYVQLNDTLNDKQKNIFNEFIDAEINVSAYTEIVHFREGLKVGLLLAIECLA